MYRIMLNPIDQYIYYRCFQIVVVKLTTQKNQINDRLTASWSNSISSAFRHKQSTKDGVREQSIEKEIEVTLEWSTVFLELAQVLEKVDFGVTKPILDPVYTNNIP